MKKLLTIILVLCSVASFGQMRGGALYDPGAMRTGNIALAATGTAALPAYSFSSDPNTGMYSAGADTLVLATDGANRVRVRPNGHVIINSETDDNCSSLQSYGAVPQTNFNTGISTSIYENLALSLRSQADGRPVTLQFSDNTNSAYYISHKEGNLYFGDSLNTNMAITSGGNVLIATSTDDGANKLQVNGNAYFYNDVSALSFTDRTPAPENLAESYAIIQSHEVKGKMLDHSKLHSAAWGTKTRINTTGRMTKRKLDDGKEVIEPETEIISEPDPNGRNLSITITAQALVIKDLIKRIEALEKNK